MLSNAQNATYINLDVDEMLPCYSDDAGLDEDCELTGRDLHPSVVVVGREGGDTRGYRTLEAGDDDTDCMGGYHMLEAGDDDTDHDSAGGYRMLKAVDEANEGGYWTLEKGDEGSIASADVAVLDAAGEAALQQHEVVRCEGDGEEEDGEGEKHI